MERRRWWFGAMVFGAVAAMTVTTALLGAKQTRSEVVVIAVTPATTTTTTTTTTSSVPTTEEPTTEEPIPIPETAPPPKPTAIQPWSLDELAEGIDLGVVMRDLKTGEDLFAHNPDLEFDSASLVKILIALDSLTNQRDPATAVVKMLATSDDNEASRMWSAGGGVRIVKTWAERIGLVGTSPPENPNRWGDTMTTAADMALIYRYLFRDPNGPVVLAGLDGMSDYGADGFDQRFGIPAAAGDRHWAVKQGWSCCEGHRTMHSTGLVGPDNRYVVVVLTGQPVKTSVPNARAKVTKIAAALLSGH